MSSFRQQVLDGAQAIGGRDFRVSMSGKNVVLQVNKAPVRFNLLVSRRQWLALVKTLKSNRPESQDYDAYAGFLFSACQPVYYRIARKPQPFSIRGRKTHTVPTSKAEARDILSSRWTKEVTVEHQGTNYFIRRNFFFKMREACLKLDKTLKAGN